MTTSVLVIEDPSQDADVFNFGDTIMPVKMSDLKPKEVSEPTPSFKSPEVSESGASEPEGLETSCKKRKLDETVATA